MLKKHESMWDDHLSRINEANHSIVLSPTGPPTLQSASYRGGSKHWEFGREDVKTLCKSVVTKPAVRKWASLVVSVP